MKTRGVGAFPLPPDRNRDNNNFLRSEMSLKFYVPPSSLVRPDIKLITPSSPDKQQTTNLVRFKTGQGYAKMSQTICIAPGVIANYFPLQLSLRECHLSYMLHDLWTMVCSVLCKEHHSNRWPWTILAHPPRSTFSNYPYSAISHVRDNLPPVTLPDPTLSVALQTGLHTTSWKGLGERCKPWLLTHCHVVPGACLPSLQLSFPGKHWCYDRNRHPDAKLVR